MIDTCLTLIREAELPGDIHFYADSINDNIIG
jgi:hypothetical protein